MSDDGERCERCGEVGYDRRTLRMACFYDMSELGIPFEEVPVYYGAAADMTPVRPPVKSPITGLPVIVSPVRCSGELEQGHLYTLRVCKPCRATWIDAIQAWFSGGELHKAVREEVRAEMLSDLQLRSEVCDEIRDVELLALIKDALRQVLAEPVGFSQGRIE